jgi:hypothetical protein
LGAFDTVRDAAALPAKKEMIDWLRPFWHAVSLIESEATEGQGIGG